jgi:hypothetical protein
MSTEHTVPMVLPSQFIQATRDSGYKGLASALAELVDNSFEAQATEVSIQIQQIREEGEEDVRVVVSDNGRGMDPETLHHALQFGWSSRFNNRDGVGRYGMGLPNSSLSQARRVEVLSSQKDGRAFSTYLDVDEVVHGRTSAIPPARQFSFSEFNRENSFRRGTTVIWKKCDRLRSRYLGVVAKHLHYALGRIFRYRLWDERVIRINGERITSVDPLFEHSGNNLQGAVPFGPDMQFPLKIPGASEGQTSKVLVKFTELPVAKWHSLSNEEKNRHHIAKNAGVSIVRAGRELDCGWFFMGSKRKENYDDWWRCEVRFEPEVDELFGVTHTKQEIHPTEELLTILSPSIESIARDLNSRARRAFIQVKAQTCLKPSESKATKVDKYLEPPPTALGQRAHGGNGSSSKQGLPGLDYKVEVKPLHDEGFFVPELVGDRLHMLVNKEHPFFEKFYHQLETTDRLRSAEITKLLELMLLAAARAEVGAKRKAEKLWAINFRRKWSNILATFLD